MRLWMLDAALGALWVGLAVLCLIIGVPALACVFSFFAGERWFAGWSR